MCGVCFVTVCSLSLLLLVPLEGCAFPMHLYIFFLEYTHRTLWLKATSVDHRQSFSSGYMY